MNKSIVYTIKWTFRPEDVNVGEMLDEMRNLGDVEIIDLVVVEDPPATFFAKTI